MAKKYKKHYVNSVIGRVHIDIGDHGVVLKQEIGNVTTGSISLTHDEMEKLARALFAIKKDLPSGSCSNPPFFYEFPNGNKPHG